MAFVLPPDEKFALIAFTGSPLVDSFPDLLELDDVLLAARGKSPAPLDATWRKWLGEIEAEQYEDTEFCLVAHQPSATLPILDAENNWLETRILCLLYGLAVQGALRFHDHQAFMVKGAQWDGKVDVRQLSQPDAFYAVPLFHPRQLTVPLAMRAYAVGLAIQELFKLTPMPVLDAVTGTQSPDHVRVRRGFNALLDGLRASTMNRRLHSFVRALDGVLKVPQGKAARQFVHRGTMLIGDCPVRRQVLHEIYALRSAEEHLSDWQAVVPDDEIARLRSVQAEVFACDVYLALLEQAGFLKCFLSDETSDAFWRGDDKEVRSRLYAHVPKQLRITREELIEDQRLWDF